MPAGRALRHVRAIRHRDHAVDRGCSAGGSFSTSGSEGQIEEDDAVLGVVDDVRDLLGEKPRVDRVDDRTHAGDGVVQLEVAVAVPGEGADAVAAAARPGAERVGEPARAARGRRGRCSGGSGPRRCARRSRCRRGGGPRAASSDEISSGAPSSGPHGPSSVAACIQRPRAAFSDRPTMSGHRTRAVTGGSVMRDWLHRIGGAGGLAVVVALPAASAPALAAAQARLHRSALGGRRERRHLTPRST